MHINDGVQSLMGKTIRRKDRTAKGFFVTGTDTGVGKTVITVALIKALGILGLRACGMKPIETGCMKEGDVLIPLYLYSAHLPTYMKLIQFIDCRENDTTKILDACREILG